ncbi:hypothetical protein BJ878DRAFT_495979 [Calycina marina]|uniref:DUF155 domain-containing protein n=1 Tax=Calycina marina TaxID=1763456 RepID=A0A9P7Z7A2_9HELO|nr:hypothetical protein BJ878DRAFT_495979 [Calycina marina]
MASPCKVSETSPLLPPPAVSPNSRKPSRNVTFSPNPSIIPTGVSTNTVDAAANPSTQHTAGPTPGQPILSALNNKLRRRNSAGSTLVNFVNTPPPRGGPQRTTKNTQKLKFLPNLEYGEDGAEEESGREVYSQYTRIKDPTARRDAARLGKADRDRLPRVTAYCTANKYQLDGMMRFLNGRGKTKGAKPKLFDECIYSPYSYGKRMGRRALEVQSTPVQMWQRRHSDSALEVEDYNERRREDLIDLHTEAGDTSLDNGDHTQTNGYHSTGIDMRINEESYHHLEHSLDFDIEVHTPEIFLFEYGVVVIWGMSLQEERRFLKEIAKFESEKLAPDHVEEECFNFYYTKEYQARIYNDFITLREKDDYMGKLAISHALAQSVKTSLFEELVDNTIEQCKDIPTQIANTGKITLTRQEINMQIGELFILRINIHLNGSILDSPELFWTEPRLEPVYMAVRSYLEMEQRVKLLMDRLVVIKDLLEVLKDQLSHGHGEKLEWIVIVLIAAEILVAGVNILVDLYAGVD